MTGNRVVSAENFQAPGFTQILVRTISRRIPFDSFSFFSKKGWHDSVPGVLVIRDEDGDLNLNYHKYWIFLIVIVYATIFGQRYYSNNVEKEVKRTFNTITYEAQSSRLFSFVDTSTVFVFQQKGSNFKPLSSCARCISKNNHTITALVKPCAKGPGIDKVRSIMNSAIIETTDTIQFDLNRAKEVYDKYNETILIKDENYLFKDIYYLGQPIFYISGGGNYRTSENFPGKQISNTLITVNEYAIELLSIKNLEGDLDWINEFPVTPDFDPLRKRSVINLKADNFQLKKSYKSELKVKSNQQELTYWIYTRNYSLKIVRVE